MAFLRALETTDCPICLQPLLPPSSAQSSQVQVVGKRLPGKVFYEPQRGCDQTVNVVEDEIAAPQSQRRPGALSDLTANDIGSLQEHQALRGYARSSDGASLTAPRGEETVSVSRFHCYDSSHSDGPATIQREVGVTGPVTIAPHLRSRHGEAVEGEEIGICDLAARSGSDVTVALQCGHLLHKACALQLLEYRNNEISAGGGTHLQLTSTSPASGRQAVLGDFFVQSAPRAQEMADAAPWPQGGGAVTIPRAMEASFSCPVCRCIVTPPSNSIVVLNPKTVASTRRAACPVTRKRKSSDEESGDRDIGPSAPRQPQPTASPSQVAVSSAEVSANDDEEVQMVALKHTSRSKVYRARLRRHTKLLHQRMCTLSARAEGLRKTRASLEKEGTQLESSLASAQHRFDVLTHAKSSGEAGSTPTHTVSEHVHRLLDLRRVAKDTQSALASITEHYADLLQEASQLASHLEASERKLSRRGAS